MFILIILISISKKLNTRPRKNYTRANERFMRNVLKTKMLHSLIVPLLLVVPPKLEPKNYQKAPRKKPAKPMIKE